MSPIRIAVLSPFIDKRYGTERLIAEWISRLPQDYEIHIYSQLVKDLDLTRMKWHRIPTLPGPHLFNFLWWFVANHLWRWWDPVIGGAHGGTPDVVDDGVTGLLVPHGDVARLSSAIERILEDPSLAKRMGEMGRERVRPFYKFEQFESRLVTM